MADTTFNLDELVNDYTQGSDTTTNVQVASGSASEAKSKSGLSA